MKSNLLLLSLFGAILVLLPISNAVVNGQITNVTWPSKSVYDPFETIPFCVNVTNTGSDEHSFWVGYSVQDANGIWWGEPELAQQTTPINPGNNSLVKLSWYPPSGIVPRGTYVAKATLWEDWNEGGPIDELGSEIKPNAFQLNYSSGFKADMGWTFVLFEGLITHVIHIAPQTRLVELCRRNV